jgi:hypothetical protein
MLLRVSSQISGTEADLHAVTEGADIASGVEGGDVLVRFAESAVRGDEDLPLARGAVAEQLGPEALVDAAAVVGNFERMVRIADGTGIPLDTPVSLLSADLREELGIDRFGSADETPPVGLLKRAAARAIGPLVPHLMRLAERLGR